MSGKTRRILSLVLSLGLLFQQIGFAQVATELNIANHLARMASSFTVDKFRPVHLRYFSYDSLTDNFKVLLDKGDLNNLKVPELESSTRTLLSYFLVGVTLPDDMFWVNLRPDSEDQIIDQHLEKTDVGNIMLEADLQLKKDTALYTSPQTPEGREYWNRLYKKATEIFGNENIEIPTLTRPWIVPGEIIVRESKDSAYVYKATLKVMLEQDYLKDSTTYNFKDERSKALNEYSSQLIRELIIPKLTKEVNSSKRYAPLRQVYYSLILSRWFKLRFTGKTGTYASLINTKDLTNLISQESWSKTDYFKQYQKSFSKGEYNIKEPVYIPTGQVIRSYFSGGINVANGAINTQNGIILANDNAVKLGEVIGGKAIVDPQNINLQPAVAASPIITSDKESAISVLRNFTLFGGNWKERKDITTEEGARAKAREFKNKFAKAKGLGQAVIVIFPEERWIKPVAEELAGTNIIVGVQSKFFGESENPNNFTPVNLQTKINLAVAMGAKYANVGHSMHRKLYINRQHREKGEPEEKGLTDEQANKIMQAILQDGRLIPWYTIEISGERDAQDEIADGVNIGLARITKEQIAAFPITPEPSGKISTKEGTGVVDTTIKVDAQDTAFLARLILQALEAKYGHPVQVNVGYGASVKGENAEGIFGNREIKNALIGGASLEAQDFLDTVVNGMKGKASASSPINYADAKIAFEGSYFMNINPAVFNSPLVLKANQYELMGEEYNFPEPDGSLSSRFGYKDPKGALRIDNRTEIMDWINKRKSEGSKVMLHFGIGGQGMSNSVQAEYWGTDKNARVIVMDRLGVNMRKLFEDLLDQGYKASEIILDVSSKSGTTDDPLSLFQDALNKFLYFVALENDMSIDAAKRLEDEFVNFLKDVNKSKDAKKDIFFTPMPVDDFLKRFNDQEREIIGKVFQRMVFTTSRNVKASRLFAFAQGMKELKVADIAVFDFSEYTGGRFTENSESGATTQAFQGLPADQVTLDLQRHAAVYWGDEGNDPNKNSALRAAILTRKLDPSVMIVAVRSSNARSEALQKEQLFPESNGKDGQGSWVVVSIGEKELARKVKQIISQTGQAPLVITVNQEGFAPMAVPDGVPTIRYYKSEISPLANAKFALWFQEFTVRYGLLSLAGMGIELDIPRVGASLMNKPKLDGKPNFWWLRDPQNQPMVELAKSALVSDLVGLGRTDQEIKNRYENEEKRIKGGRYIEDAEINLLDYQWGTSLDANSKRRLLLFAERRIGLAAESLKNIIPEVTGQSVLATLERIRLLKSQVESLAAELKVAKSNNDRLGIQERIEEIDDSISRFYNSIRSFGKGRLSDSYMMESAANKLAALMLIAKDNRKILSPVFYSANPNADILGEFLQAVDYGIGTRDQHANFQHRHDGKDVVFTVLVDFVMTYEQVKAQQEKIRTFGLANDYLEGLYPDELRRGFVNAELKSLSGEVKVDAINHQGREYQNRFHRDVAKLLLPDISTPEGMLTAMRIFNRAQALFDDYSSLESRAVQTPISGGSASSALGNNLEEQPGSYMYVGEPITSGVMPELVANYYSDEDLLWVMRKGNTEDIKTVPLDPKTAAAVKFGTSGDRGTFDDSNPDKRFNIQRTLRVAQGIADYYRTQGLKGAVPVGYDNRALSREYAYLITAVLTANDIVVELTDTATPVPVVAYAVAASQKTQKPMAGGIIVTASHNPWEYNGIKWMLPNGGAPMASVTELIEDNAKKAVQAKIMPIDVALREKLATILDFKQRYISYVLDRFPEDAQKTIRAWGLDSRNAVMVNPMQGASIGYLSAILKELGIKDIREVNTKVDRMFTEVKNTPNPDSALDFDLDIAESQAVQMKSVVELLADGDADRFGVRDVTGEKFTANELIPLFKAFLREKGYKGAIAKTLVTSDLSNAVDEADRMITRETDTGFKYLVDALESGGYLVAGEESAHVGLHLFKESKDDGIAVGLMALWIIAEKGSLTKYLEEVETKIGRDFRYRRIDTAYSEKQGLVQKGQEMVKLINLPEAARIVQYSGYNYAFDYQSNMKKFEKLEIIARKILPVAQANGGIAKVFICYDPLSKKSSGYKIVFNNKSWVAIRVSGTGEPVIRLYVEAVSDLGKDNRIWAEVRQESINTWQKLAESARDAIGLIKTSERLGTASFNIKGYYPTRRSIAVNIRIDGFTVSIYRSKPKGITTLELFKKEVLNELREKYGNDIDFVFSDYRDGLAVYDVVRSASSPISSDEDFAEASSAALTQQDSVLAASSAVAGQPQGMLAMLNNKTPWRSNTWWDRSLHGWGYYNFEHKSKKVEITYRPLVSWREFWEITLIRNDRQFISFSYLSGKGLGVKNDRDVFPRLLNILTDEFVTLDSNIIKDVEVATFIFSDLAISKLYDLGFTDDDLSDFSDSQLHWRVISLSRWEKEEKARRESGSAASGAGAASLPVKPAARLPITFSLEQLESPLESPLRDKIGEARNNAFILKRQTYKVCIYGEQFIAKAVVKEFQRTDTADIAEGVVFKVIKELPGAEQSRYMFTIYRNDPDPDHSGNNLFIRMITPSPVASSSINRPETTGGIDFRALPMAIQPMGSFQGLNFKLPQLSQAELEKMDVAVEMQQIKNMLQAGIIPSGERIKELIAACVQKGQINSQIDNLLLCLADTFKLEEENASESSPELREALVIVDSQS